VSAMLLFYRIKSLPEFVYFSKSITTQYFGTPRWVALVMFFLRRPGSNFVIRN